MTPDLHTVALENTFQDKGGEPPKNVAELLLRAARRFPQAGISVLRTERDEPLFIAYPELLKEAENIAAGLQKRGFLAGSKIALLLERADDFLPAFWGCILGGYVPSALVPNRADRQRWEKHLSHVNSLLDNPVVVTTGALKDEVPGMIVEEIDGLRATAGPCVMYPALPAELAAIILTSGSTGNAKGVRLTHANLLASMQGKQERRDLRPADIVLNWINFDHVAALLEAHMLGVYSGASLLHVDAAEILADPLLLLRIIDRFRVSIGLVPNFLLAQINAALGSAGVVASKPLPPSLDLSCVRHVITGGESNVVETGRRFLELLAPAGLAHGVLWPGFGMTETCGGVIYSSDFPDADTGHEFASLGFPIHRFERRIADEAGIPLPDGEPGELQLRGDMVFAGYHNNDEETKAAFTADGWFRTGDLGCIEAGRLRLVGRSKECINVNGVKYFSHELEAVLEPLDGIEHSFVAAFPTRPNGAATEQLVIAFAPSFPPEDDDKLYQLLVAVRNTTVLLWGFRPSLMLPLVKSDFPRTSMGKIQRSLLRKRLEAGAFAACIGQVADLTMRQLGGYAPPGTEIERQIAEIYAEIFALDPATVSVTASFFDLGGTSLDIIKLIRKLEQRFGTGDLAMTVILQNPTARALASYVARGDDRGRHAYDPVVPLQLTGGKTPLFCIHPAIGEILVYVNLAKYFVNERPIYALRARGLNEGEEYFETLDEMTDTYLAAIRRIQPHGPYALAGYSFGGLVGFEIAKKLEAMGERVPFFCNIDAPPSATEPICPDYCAISLAYFLSLIPREQMLDLHQRFQAEEPGLCDQLIAIADAARLAELNLDARKFKEWVNLAVFLGMMGKAYVPSGNVEATTVLYAQPRWGTIDAWLNGQLKRWAQFVRTPPRYIAVRGEHHSLLGAEYLGTFQAVLRNEMNRALAGA